MMDHDFIADALDHITYRPEWTITAHRHPFGTYVLIDAVVIDAEKYRSDVPVDVNYKLGNTTRVGVRACVPPDLESLPELLDWLLNRIAKVEIHECREFFMLDGKPWNSPHQTPQPKHDYHVRRLALEDQPEWNTPFKFNWFVLDSQELILAGLPSQRAAFLHALKLVVTDDLAKGMTIKNG